MGSGLPGAGQSRDHRKVRQGVREGVEEGQGANPRARSAQSPAGAGTTRADAWWRPPGARRIAAGLSLDVPGPNLHAQDRGSSHHSLPGRSPGQDLQSPARNWPPTPDSLPPHTAPAHQSAASTFPTAAPSASSAQCSPLSSNLPTLRPRQSGLLPAQTRLRQSTLGQAVLVLAPPPYPGSLRHDPRWSPLRPATSHETTRSHSTFRTVPPP